MTCFAMFGYTCIGVVCICVVQSNADKLRRLSGALQSLCLFEFEHKDNRVLHHAHTHFVELLLGAHISETVAAKARFTIMTIAHLSIDDR